MSLKASSPSVQQVENKSWFDWLDFRFCIGHLIEISSKCSCNWLRSNTEQYKPIKHVGRSLVHHSSYPCLVRACQQLAEKSKNICKEQDWLGLTFVELLLLLDYIILKENIYCLTKVVMATGPGKLAKNHLLPVIMIIFT